MSSPHTALTLGHGGRGKDGDKALDEHTHLGAVVWVGVGRGELKYQCEEQEEGGIVAVRHSRRVKTEGSEETK